MKKFLLILIVTTFYSGLFAQLPNGSTAPDWTLTDINGNSHHLYSYLDSGYTVFIDFSATWCGPCWNYHNSGNLENLYNSYGPEGTNEVRVFFIEGDAGTNLACLYGQSGCSGGTQGNWVEGTPYPIINDASQTGPYQIGYWPTIYGICSNHEITEVGQQSTAGLYAFHNSCPAAPVNIDIVVENVQNATCNGYNDGAIDISVSGGSGDYSYQWNTSATTQDIDNLFAGIYSVVVTDNSNGSTATANDIQIEEPSAIVLTETFYQPVTCAGGGNDGAVGYSASGGTPGYSYYWSNGQGGSTIGDLAPGSYTLVVEDDAGCTATAVVDFDEPDYPTVHIINANVPEINCNNSTVTLDASGSSYGADFTILWTTQDGNIVSGATTLYPVVNQPGTYFLTITNTQNGCQTTGDVTVTGSTTPPNVNIQIVGSEILSCASPTTQLEGSSTTQGAVLSWTGPGGFTSSDVLITVSQAGDYILTATDPSNGCTASQTVTIFGNFAEPNAGISYPTTVLSCQVGSIQLTGTSTTSNTTFAWTGPNGFTASTAVVTVTLPGTYELVVTDQTNGCASTAIVEITGGADEPNISVAFAGSEILTCAEPSLVINGSSTTPGVTYAWTGPGGFTANTPSITVSVAGNYTLTVTNPANGCSASQIVEVFGGADLPDVNIQILGNEILTCAEPSTLLQGSSATSGVSLAWTGPGGFTSNDTLITVTQSGDYTLTATDSATECSASTTVTIFADFEAPNSTITPSNPLLTCNTPCVDLTVGNGGNNLVYIWNYLGLASTEPTLTVCQPGTAEVIVTNTVNGCSSENEVSIAVAPNLAISCEVVTQPTTAGGNDGVISVTATSGTAPFSVSLNGQPGTITAIGESLSFEGLAAGTYQVVVTDAYGCEEDCSTVLVDLNCDNPATADAGDPITVCAGEEISLNGSFGGSATSATWSGGEGTFSDNTSPTTTYVPTESEINAGSVVLVLTTNDPDGNGPCEPATSTVKVFFKALPVVSSGEYPAVCSGEEIITLAGTPSGGGFSGDGVVNNTFDVSLVEPGVYPVTYTYTDGNGCANTSITEIEVKPTPSLSLTGGEICCNTPAVTIGVEDDCVGDAGYSWEGPGDVSNDYVVTVPGTYELTVECENGCTAVADVTIEECANNMEIQVAVTDASGETIADGGAQLSITGGTAPFTYIWKFNGETVSDSQNLEDALPGKYILIVTDANGCQSEMEVTIDFITATQEPTWAKGLQVYPNPSDGFFVIRLANIRSLDVTILDAIGQVVYTAKMPYGKKEINLSGIPEGIYFLKLQAKEGFVYRKITVER